MIGSRPGRSRWTPSPQAHAATSSTNERVYDLTASASSENSATEEAERWQQAISSARDSLPSRSRRAPVEVHPTAAVMHGEASPQALIAEAKARQRSEKDFAGAEHLFGAAGLQPQYWGVNRRQLERFRSVVSARWGYLAYAGGT